MSVSRRALSLTLLGVTSSLFMAACSSTNAAREEARHKIVQSSKLYCEFVNGDNNPDIDVAVNLAIGVKCDADRAFSLTAYRTPSDINGVLYCCGLREPKSEVQTPVAQPVKAATKSKKDELEELPEIKTEAKAAPAPVVAPTAVPVKEQNVVPQPAPAAPAATPAPAPTPVPQAAAPARSAASVPQRRTAPVKKAAPSQITFSGESELDQ